MSDSDFDRLEALRQSIAAIESREHAKRQRPSGSNSTDAFQKIVRLVSVRDRSCSEMRERLAREGFEEAETTQAIERACACGILDDGRFADVFVRSKIASGKGLRGIESELARHGINASDLPDWPEGYLPQGCDGEVERALALLAAKPPRSKNLREAAFRRLISKGFSTEVAAQAARRWSENGVY